MIKVLYKHDVKDKWHIIYCPNRLESFQKLVDGYIETVSLPYGGVLICNEEALFSNMKFNVRIGEMQLFGPVAIVGAKGEEFDNVPETYVYQWEGKYGT